MRKLALSFGCLALASTCLAQSNWIQVKPKTSPPGRWGHGNAYDLVRGQMVVFGGGGSAGSLNDTWVYDGTNWTKMNPKTSPPARSFCAMVFHFARVQTLLFGGSGGGRLNDTWTWDGKDWTKMNPKTSPPGRFAPACAYDSGRQRTVIFGGVGPSGDLADTWEWDGSDWKQITTKNAPSARNAGFMEYDSARKRIVLFGGGGSGQHADTWEYDGKDWTKMSPTTSPPSRCCYGMAYDPGRQRTVIFGGFPGFRSDTWEYDGKTWVQAKPTTSPTGRYDLDMMVYDQRRKRLVIFGGLGSGRTFFADTWEYVAAQPLTGSPSTISIASGGTHTFSLDAGTTQASRLYWIFGSVTGTTPGVNLASLAGTVNLPLNPDIWTDITIAFANSALLTKTRGTLDASGKGSATFNVPKITNQSAIGVKFYHAFLVYDARQNFHMTSNPVELQLAK